MNTLKQFSNALKRLNRLLDERRPSDLRVVYDGCVFFTMSWKSECPQVVPAGRSLRDHLIIVTESSRSPIVPLDPIWSAAVDLAGAYEAIHAVEARA